MKTAKVEMTWHTTVLELLMPIVDHSSHTPEPIPTLQFSVMCLCTIQWRSPGGSTVYYQTE